MRSADWIATVYFAYIALAALRARAVPAARRASVAALAGGSLASILLLALTLDPSHPVRLWAPALWLLLGYWLPGGLLHAPMPSLEARLLAWDVRAQRLWSSRVGTHAAPSWLRALLEAAYLLVHVFVPAGLIVLLTTSASTEVAARANQFWTAALLAGYACYGTLPWLQARPPRLIEPISTSAATAPTGAGTGEVASGLRAANERLLDLVSVKANTFPSGHVAVALAVALLVSTHGVIAGLIFIPAALLIALATIVGRYHYVADVVLGLGIGLGAWMVTRGL